tara:strand:+ start:23807 stop:25852 length:2046 start_codon:yes stop_codon:yes gene_type:complete
MTVHIETKQTDKLRLYHSHGIQFTDKGGSQVTGDCPFCGKEEKFYVSKTKGMYHCKVCGEKGNGYTFLSKLIDQCKDETSDSQYRKFGKERGLSPAIMKRENLAYDSQTKRWLLPVWNGSESVANILTYDNSLQKGKTRSTATCARHLYRANLIAEEGPIYVCEGEWDALALLTLMDKVGATNINVVAVPGAETFKKEWVEYFKDREVTLLYDNDGSGQDGKQKVIDTLRDVAKHVRSLHWPLTMPDKYDIRDLVSEYGVKNSTWKRLHEMVVDESGRPAKPTMKRTSFKSILKDFRKGLHFDKDMEDALLVTLATVVSNKIPGDPLWIYVVGPPGCGKSMILQSFMNSLNCVFRSKLTATSFISGMKQEDGSDPSLLAQLNGKSLLIKDFTAVKSMPIVVQEHLYGILRDAYDGNVLVEYGNGVKRNYPDVHFSIVAGITDIVHGDNRAALGERFLKVEMIPSDKEYDQEAQIRASIANVVNNVKAEANLKDCMEAFLYHVEETFDLEKLPTVPNWVIDRVVSLCQIVGLLRSTVLRERNEDVSYRPRPEIGTRLANQLIKLGRACAYVSGKDAIDKDIYAIMEKVAFSTAHGWHSEIVREMIHHNRGITVEKLAETLQISVSSVQRRLSDLQELKIVVSEKKSQQRRGRPTNAWRLTDAMLSHWKTAKVGLQRIDYGEG